MNLSAISRDLQFGISLRIRASRMPCDKKPHGEIRCERTSRSPQGERHPVLPNENARLTCSFRHHPASAGVLAEVWAKPTGQLRRLAVRSRQQFSVHSGLQEAASWDGARTMVTHSPAGR